MNFSTAPYRLLRPCSLFGRTRAFTLVEIMVVLMIFGVVMLGCLGLLIAAVRSIRVTREELYVNRVIESTIEEIRDLSWAELIAQPASQGFLTSYPIVNLFGKP